MTRKKELKINLKYIFYFLLLLPFIRVRTMEDFPNWIRDLYNYAGILSSIVFIVYATQKKYLSHMKTVFPILLMMITYILITLFNNPSSISQCYNCVFFIAVAMFLNVELHQKPYDIIKTLAFLYTAMILLNNLLVLLYPNGIYESVVTYHKGHLLGDDNAIIYFALPGMIILTICSLMKHGKISRFTWLNIFLCEFIFIKQWTVSAVISFGLFIILVIIGTKFIKLSPMKLFILLVSFCAFIFIGLNAPFIVDLITNYLHKDITFSGRTHLWQHGFDMISQRPLFGYGGYFVEGRSLLNHRLYPVHTTHLQILIDGGIVLFSEYILILVTAFRKLTKYKKTGMAQVICAGLIAIGLSYAFEQAGLYHLIILVTIALNIDQIIQYRKNKEELL